MARTVSLTRPRPGAARASALLLPLALLLAACSSSEPPPDELPPEAPAATPALQPTEAGMVPIVDATQSRLFGGAAGGRWLPPDSVVPHLEGGERYRLYSLRGALGEGTGGAPQPAEEFCDTPTLRVDGVPPGATEVIAIGGSRDALPRAPVPLDPQGPIYREAVAGLLRSKGIADPQVHISRLLRVDLEGDGTDEVLLSATLRRGQGTSALPGDYSVVALRRVVAGEVRTVPLVEEYHPEGCQVDCAPSEYEVTAVLDANGDGMLEVVVATRYYEGESRSIYHVEGEQVSEVLSWNCGV